mmetsp:Transcript_105686/g.170022  ORF Transcript_105686/g.170022 Transcript_105686/m.170022 type:complete len:214 (-) Transcript_105686:1250-1891(-)
MQSPWWWARRAASSVQAGFRLQSRAQAPEPLVSCHSCRGTRKVGPGRASLEKRDRVQNHPALPGPGQSLLRLTHCPCRWKHSSARTTGQTTPWPLQSRQACANRQRQVWCPHCPRPAPNQNCPYSAYYAQRRHPVHSPRPTCALQQWHDTRGRAGLPACCQNGCVACPSPPLYHARARAPHAEMIYGPSCGVQEFCEPPPAVPHAEPPPYAGP